MLNTTQLQALSVAIAAETDPAFVDLRTQGATGMMAEWLNGPSSVVVWRTSVPQDEIMQNGLDWTRVDNLSIGAARVWEWMFDNQQSVFNPSKPNVRAGIDAVWKGTAADLAVRAAVYLHCKRFATRAEKLFSTGVGTDASPSNLAFEGGVTDYEVTRAISDY